MNEDLRMTLIHIRLLVCGAIEMMERYAPKICEQVEERDALVCAIESIREGLYGAREKTEGALLHEMGEASYSVSHLEKAL